MVSGQIRRVKVGTGLVKVGTGLVLLKNFLKNRYTIRISLFAFALCIMPRLRSWKRVASKRGR